MKKEIGRRCKLEREMAKIPTIREVMKKEKISWEEASKECVILCGQEHKNKNIDCHRKLNGYPLCQNCPKYQPEKRELPRLDWVQMKKYAVLRR
jgi:hypothetical protein